MQIRGHFLKAEFYVSQNKVPLDFQNSHFWGRGGRFVLFFTRTRIENAKLPRIANPRPLYYATFLRLQNNFFQISEIFTYEAVAVVLSFSSRSHASKMPIWTRKRVRTGIENGKWPRNAIPRAHLLTKLFTFTKQKFFRFWKFRLLRPWGPFCPFGHGKPCEHASKMPNVPEMQFRGHIY